MFTVDYLARNHELYQLIKESSPPDPETHSVPHKSSIFPFPFSRETLKLSNNMFTYIGRERFRELWAGISRMENNGWVRIYLYGTVASGY